MCASLNVVQEDCPSSKNIYIYIYIYIYREREREREREKRKWGIRRQDLIKLFFILLFGGFLFYF